MESKLSQTQAEVLEAIKKAGSAEYTHYMGRFGGDYWYVQGIGRCSAQVKALIKKGYLEVKQTSAFGDKRANIAYTRQGVGVALDDDPVTPCG